MPLWLAKPRVAAARPCIVAAVDPVHERDKPAELDHAILTIGAELGEALGGRLEAFHASPLALPAHRVRHCSSNRVPPSSSRKISTA